MHILSGSLEICNQHLAILAVHQEAFKIVKCYLSAVEGLITKYCIGCSMNVILCIY